MAQQTDDATAEESTTAADQVRALADHDHLTNRLEGRKGGLRSSKPQTDDDTGLTQCVWRFARLSSGADTAMPVTACWALQDFLDENDIDASVSGVTDDAGKEVISVVFDLADEVLHELAEPTGQGARRWNGLAY
jgi:hypothetical protein